MRTEDQLIGTIYDAAEGSWQPVLVAIARALRAEKGHMFRIDARGTLVGPPEFLNVHPTEIDEYHHHFASLDARLAIAKANPGRFFSDVQVLQPDAFEATAIYNEHLAPNDVRYSLFGVLPVDANCLAPQGFFRPWASGPFEPEDVALFERLLPHIRRSLRLKALLDSANDRVRDLQAALDQMAPPVLVLDSTGRLLCASASAEALLAKGDGLSVAGGRLHTPPPPETPRLQRVLSETVAWSDSTGSPPASVLEVTRNQGAALRLLFLPLRVGHSLRTEADGRARVLVVIHDPDAVVQTDPGLIAQLHGLTPTEGLLAAAVASGQSLREFAQARGSSEQTVRTQMKRILEKTGLHRQADLVRLVLSTSGVRTR